MLNIIKDYKGNIVKEPTEKLVIQMLDGSMYEASDYREATACICGMEYLDCETAETEWHMRIDKAKKIGLFLIGSEERDNVIVYDERIGKIPYSYTAANPDYDIPADPELIRIECDETFVLTLHKIRYITIWEHTENDYQSLEAIRDIDKEIEQILIPFKEKVQRIPLHKRLAE